MRRVLGLALLIIVLRILVPRIYAAFEGFSVTAFGQAATLLNSLPPRE